VKLALKRGALVAAANWPVTCIQATADWLFKALVAMPLAGSLFLVALVVGAEPGALLDLEWRDLVATILASLRSRPIVLTAFLTSLALAVIGGSVFVFLVKGGTVGVLVRGDRRAGPIEEWPFRVETLTAAAAFSAETFIETAWALFPRFAQLGALLIGAYVLSGGMVLGLALFERPAPGGWATAAFVTAVLVAWLTLVNFVYLLLQIVIAADDCSVPTAASRVAVFLRKKRREVTAVFLVVLGLVVASTGASLLATTALGLIAFVPLFGVAVLPLQLLAWVMRGMISEYIDVTSIGAYVRLYRESAAEVLVEVPAAVPAPELGRPSQGALP
jgi:hypothetical protein